MLEAVDSAFDFADALWRQRQAGELAKFPANLGLVVWIQAVSPRTVAGARDLPPVLQRERDAGRPQGRQRRVHRRVFGDVHAVAKRRYLRVVERRVVD
jgi:hypothetical protein